MSQVTIYLEKDLAKRLRTAAKDADKSQSRWLAELIREKLDNQWPAEVAGLAGAWDDFPEAEQLRQGIGRDVEREEL